MEERSVPNRQDLVISKLIRNKFETNNWITKTTRFLPRQPRHCDLDEGCTAHQTKEINLSLLTAILE